MAKNSRVSIQEIAKTAGVSPTAVSMVLNDKARLHGIKDETIARIKAVMDRLHYRPTLRGRLARTGRSRMVGLVAETTFDEKWGEFYFRLEQHLRTIGHFLITSSVPPAGDLLETIQKFLDIPIDALIVRAPTREVSELCRDMDLPLIALEHVPGAKTVIKGDDLAIGRLAAQTLMEGGACAPVLAFPENRVRGDQERMDAFTRVFEAAGRAVHVFDCSVLEGDRPEVDRGILEFLEGTRHRTGGALDAVFGYDTCCIAWMMSLRRLGIEVPDRVQLIGCHDYSFGRYVDPPLTTMASDFSRMGDQVFDHLKPLLLPGEPTTEGGSGLVAPTLHRRGTTRSTA